MEKIVYILGAGFSAPLGLPVMSNFYEKSKDMYFANIDKYKYFKRIFNKVNDMSFSKNYYETNLFNIEEILSILEMKDSVTKSTSYRKLFKEYITDVINYFTPKFDISYNNKADNNWNLFLFGNSNDSLLNFYGYFVCGLFQHTFINQTYDIEGEIQREIVTYLNDKIKNSYSIITLNYDLVIENISNFAFNKYAEINRKKIGLNRPNDEKFINCPNLIKLHGCINRGNLIAPTWNKLLHDKQIKSEWKKAYEVLKEATQIRIIGYSLPVSDSYIKYLLRTAIIESNEKNLKKIDLICEDPTEELYDRYKSFINFHNFRFKNENCLNYLKYIYNYSQKVERIKSYTNTHYFLRFDKLEEIHNSYFF